MIFRKGNLLLDSNSIMWKVREVYAYASNNYTLEMIFNPKKDSRFERYEHIQLIDILNMQLKRASLREIKTYRVLYGRE